MSPKPNIARRLFIAVTLAFILLGAAWATLIFIASQNAPEPIDVPPSQTARDG